MSEARYFYAPALFASNAKLFILTMDGRLYTSSQDNLSKVYLLESEINFKKFQAWDINVESSPLLLEVTFQVMESFIGKDYPGWWNALLENNSIPEFTMAQAS